MTKTIRLLPLALAATLSLAACGKADEQANNTVASEEVLNEEGVDAGLGNVDAFATDANYGDANAFATTDAPAANDADAAATDAAETNAL